MVELHTLRQLENAPIEERIKIIEWLLQSVKNDLKRSSKPQQPFKVRSFSLGSDIAVNREEIYSNRIA